MGYCPVIVEHCGLIMEYYDVTVEHCRLIEYCDIAREHLWLCGYIKFSQKSLLLFLFLSPLLTSLNHDGLLAILEHMYCKIL